MRDVFARYGFRCGTKSSNNSCSRYKYTPESHPGHAQVMPCAGTLDASLPAHWVTAGTKSGRTADASFATTCSSFDSSSGSSYQGSSQCSSSVGAENTSGKKLSEVQAVSEEPHTVLKPGHHPKQWLVLCPDSDARFLGAPRVLHTP